MGRKNTDVAETGYFTTREPALYEEAITPWDLTVDLRHSKTFECEIRYIKLDGITIYRDRYASDMRLQGMTPPDTLTLCLPLGGLTDDTTFWGERIDVKGIYPAFFRELDSHTARCHDQIIILINTAVLEPECGDFVDYFDFRRGPLFLSPTASIRLRTELEALFVFASDASLLANPAVAATLRDDLVSTLRKVLPDTHRGSPVRRREISAISKLFEYLSDQAEPPLSISRLCRTAGISERTLERAVRAKFDCTVQSLLRRRRFHEARRRLLYSEPDRASVTSISHDLGFYDCGRFARDYRTLFEEIPSSTLRRPPVDPVDPLLRW